MSAVVYSMKDGYMEYLLVEEASGFHSFPKGHPLYVCKY